MLDKMFVYDNVYNKLFENEEFLEILYGFHSSNWEKMSVEERKILINLFVDKYSEVLGINKLKFKKEKSRSYAGSYNDVSGLVNVNSEAIESTSQYDIMDTLFHELRHNFQHRAVSKNLTEYETADVELVKQWKLNFLCSPRGYSNYIDTKGDHKNLYMYQPVEKDAFMTGLSLTKKAYSLIKEKLGEDDAFVEYAKIQKYSIMLYFSDEEMYVAGRKLGAEQVAELFEKNNKEKQIEKKCVKIAEETIKKAISDMSLEEIISLFSVYVWAYLDDDYKLELLKEYDKRVNKGKLIKIELDGNSVIKLNGKMYMRDKILSILNDMYTVHFQNLVKEIIKGNISVDSKMKEELTINMYQVDKKKINYVKDSENFLLYSIQPFALLEGKVVIEWFKEIKAVEKKFYDIDSEEYEDMIDFYDYDKYIPFIEKFYGMPFEDVYNEQVEKMKINIRKQTR